MAKVLSLSPNGAGRRHTIHAPVTERTEPLMPPKELTDDQRQVWDRFVEPCRWLSDGDAILAYVFTCLTARYLRDDNSVSAADVAQLRLLAGDLGIRPAERARLSKPKGKAGKERFFD